MADEPTPSQGDPIGDFAWAVKTGDLASVKDAVEKKGLGIDTVDATVTKGTPMHWAADFNQVAVLEYLLGKGADVNAKNAYGITPLLSATYESHKEAVEFLLKKGADKNAKGPDGMTAQEAAEKPEIKALF
jgi:ankyrin repeat protein